MNDPLHKAIKFDRHAIINASAGTGKTYTIQNLYVRLVAERGLDPAQILVLTFTEKATAELRQKIRSELLRTHSSPDEAARTRSAHALLTFDNAQIFTIHGFCQRALSQFAYENGEPFRLNTADDSEIYSSALHDLLRNDWPQRFGAALPGLLTYAGFSQKGEWEKKVITLARKLRLRPLPPDQFTPSPPTEAALLATQKRVKELFARIAELSRTTQDGIPLPLAQFHRLAREEVLNGTHKNSSERLLLAALQHATHANADLLSAAHVLGSGKRSTKSLARAKSKREPELAACRELSELVELLREMEAAASYLSGAFTALAVYALNAAVEIHKRNEGSLSFDDMLTRLRDALDETVSPQTAPLLLDALRGRYQAAIVDEAQDTDRVQWDILRRVFAVDTATMPQRLFAVGDPKQAIYAFRGADVQAYVRACEILRDSAQTRDLPDNWRSTESLVNVLNALFETDYFDAKSHFAYTRVNSVPDEKRKLSVLKDSTRHAASLVVYTLNDDKEDSVSSDDIQDRIAHFVSEEVAALLQSPRIGLREGGVARELQPGDICLLVASRREALPLEQALMRLGIPHARYKKEGLYESDEALNLGYLLAAIARTGDDAALKRALLTPFFGMTPSELAGAGELPPEHRARVLLSSWRQKAERREWPALFRSILYDTRILFTRADGVAGSERRQMNLLHLCEELENTARRQHLDFLGLADHLQRCRFQSVTLDEGAGLQRVDSERSKVQIMTMHVSKGLEFPVVFIAGGLGTDKHPDYLTYHSGDAIVYDLQMEEAAKERARSERDDEAKRLYYVALTRAQVKLYVPHLRESKRPMARLLGPRVQALLDAKTPGVLAARWNSCAPALSSTPTVQPETTIHVLAALEPVLDGVLPQDYSLRRRVHRSYSALKQEHRAFGDAPFSRAADEAGHSARRVEPSELPGGTEMGSLLHKLLEVIDFPLVTKSPSAAALAAEPAYLKLLKRVDTLNLVLVQPRRIAATASILWHTLNTPVDGSGFSLGQLAPSDRLCEMEFTFPLPYGLRPRQPPPDVEGYLNGFIDLVYRRTVNGTPRYFVLDWKSDALEAYDTNSLRAHMDAMEYTLQYKVYALAVAEWLRQAGLDPAVSFGGLQYVFLRGMGRADSQPGAGILTIPLPNDLSAWRLELYARLNERSWREGSP